MAYFYFECEPCGFSVELSGPISSFDALEADPPECEKHGGMVQVWPRRIHRPFPEFDAAHLRVGGQPVHISSLSDVRRLEKEGESVKRCFELFSYDNEHYGEDLK